MSTPINTLADAALGGTLVYNGGAVKSLDASGRLGGHLVLFGDPNSADRSPTRDFFTPATDFGFEAESVKSRVLWMHGIQPGVGRVRLGSAVLGTDATGVTVEANLDLDQPFVKSTVWPMARTGKLGWSSGAARHTVERVAHDNGAHEIKSWYLAEASLTPCPADPRNIAHAIKSLADVATDATKNGDYDPNAAARMGALSRLCDALMSRVYYVTAETGEGQADALRAAFDETRDVALSVLAALTPSDADEVKSMLPAALARVFTGLRLGDHLDTVHAAVSGLSERVKGLSELKSSDTHPRPFPTARRDAFRAILDEAEAVYVLTEPKLSQEEAHQLFLQSEAVRARLLGVHAPTAIGSA
jgi:hypothetical protein